MSCLAFIDTPLKAWRSGSKLAFMQEPYINVEQNTKLVQLQKQMTQLWPKGVINYYLNSTSYDSFLNSSLQAAMRLIESESCIQFEEESDKPSENKTWIHFTNPNRVRKCVHEPQYMPSGEIIMTLGYDCLKKSDILHSLLHAIGFKDEVTHPHRDKYIRVLWSNIQPGYHHLFTKESSDSVRNSLEYDPLSLMHFNERAFTLNGKPTIMPLEPGFSISPSENLSQLDRMRLQLYYSHECNRRNIGDLLNSCKATLQNKTYIKEIKEDRNGTVEEEAGKTNYGKDLEIKGISNKMKIVYDSEEIDKHEVSDDSEDADKEYGHSKGYSDNVSGENE